MYLCVIINQSGSSFPMKVADMSKNTDDPFTHTRTCSNSTDVDKNHTPSGWGLTSREGELNLLVDDLHGDEVVLLIEPAVVEKQSIPLSGSKPADKKYEMQPWRQIFLLQQTHFLHLS